MNSVAAVFGKETPLWGLCFVAVLLFPNAWDSPEHREHLSKPGNNWVAFLFSSGQQLELNQCWVIMSKLWSFAPCQGLCFFSERFSLFNNGLLQNLAELLTDTAGHKHKTDKAK